MQRRYDVLIIGGGSAGCVLANRLSRNQKRQVMLLEAGPDYPDPSLLPADVVDVTASVPSQVWGYSGLAHPAQARSVLYPGGKLMGGSSAVNATVFLRGLREDFDGWAAGGCPLWSYDKVLPYFFRSETDLDCGCEFHGREGPLKISRVQRKDLGRGHQAFLRAFEAAGVQWQECLNAPDANGVGIVPHNAVDRRRQSAAIAYLDPVRRRPNLTIRPEVRVVRILFGGGKAIGIEFEHGRDRETVLAEEIVVCCGAIGSPFLLMLSGLGPVDSLVASGIEVVAPLPGIGSNLRDHPVVRVVFSAVEGLSQPTAAGPQLSARYTSRRTRGRNDLSLNAYAPVALAIDATVRAPIPGAFAAAVPCILNTAVGAGTVRLDQRGVDHLPRIDFNYLIDDVDRVRLREGVRFVAQVLGSSAMDGLGTRLLSPTEEQISSDSLLDAWLLATMTSAYHVAGTCKMGPASDAMAVVDEQLRVRGVQGLRIVDASIMPDVVSANTNASAVMLAERAAEFLS